MGPASLLLSSGVGTGAGAASLLSSGVGVGPGTGVGAASLLLSSGVGVGAASLLSSGTGDGVGAASLLSSGAGGSPKLLSSTVGNSGGGRLGGAGEDGVVGGGGEGVCGGGGGRMSGIAGGGVPGGGGGRMVGVCTHTHTHTLVLLPAHTHAQMYPCPFIPNPAVHPTHHSMFACVYVCVCVCRWPHLWCVEAPVPASKRAAAVVRGVGHVEAQGASVGRAKGVDCVAGLLAEEGDGGAERSAVCQVEPCDTEHTGERLRTHRRTHTHTCQSMQQRGLVATKSMVLAGRHVQSEAPKGGTAAEKESAEEGTNVEDVRSAPG